MDYSIEQLKEMKAAAFEELTYCCYLESEARLARQDAYQKYKDIKAELQFRTGEVDPQ